MAKRADPRVEVATRQFSDWKWRLNNLYWILDKDGDKVRFELNTAQQSLYDNMHYLNVILKARQQGFSTFIQIFMLDACLFNENIQAGTIAHTKDDAQEIFRSKIKFPYDSLPEALRKRISIVRDNATALELSNGSSIRVGTSLRSGTLQYLHISEYGKLCARFPEKAREVRTGALNTVQAGQVAFIESTAEGQEGHFFELCEKAQEHQRRRVKLGKLDWKFHFSPWWVDKTYQIDPEGVEITDDAAKYFADLEKELEKPEHLPWLEPLRVPMPVRIGPEQRAWYVKKQFTQLDDMLREYPSTPAEAFKASLEGAYYGTSMEAAEREGRIGQYPADLDLPVHTAWDIGRKDYTSIWFFQVYPGRIRVVGFYQNCDYGMPHYAAYVKERFERCRWRQGGHVFPHDARVTEWGSDKSRIEQLIGAGIEPTICPDIGVHDGINAVRAVLPACEFDVEGCGEGIKVLKSYRREWDENLGVFKNQPKHDWASHGADAFRYLAVAHRDVRVIVKPKPVARDLVFEVNRETGRLESSMSVTAYIEAKKRKRLIEMA